MDYSQIGSYFPFFDFPALLRAIATDCFCGLPAFISVFMLLEMIFLLEPFFSGIWPPKKCPRYAGYGGEIS